MPFPEREFQPGTYCVQVPESALPEQLEALRAVVRAFGWALDNPGPTDYVQNEHFLDVSRQLFDGDETAGHNALTFLETERQRFTGVAALNHSAYGPGLPMLYFRSGIRYFGLPSIWYRDRTEHAADLHEAVRARINSLKPPFDMRYELTTDEGQDAVRYAASHVTLSGLRAFVQRREYDKSTLRHGAMRDMFATLARAAGFEPPTHDEPREDFDFETIDQVLRGIQEDAGAGNLDRVTDKIFETLREQLETGRPTKHGELVIDGPFDIVEQKVALIGRQSLTVVADRYVSQPHARAPRALRAYAAA